MRVLVGAFTENAELIRENFHTAIVCLRDGNYIKRHKIRDFVDFDMDKKDRIKPISDIDLSKVPKNRWSSVFKKAWATLVQPIGQQGSEGVK